MRRHETSVGRVGRLSSIALSRSVAVIEAVAFWGAVITPLSYLPALSLNSSAELIPTLVAVNVVCLFLGHGHRPSRDGERLVAAVRSVIGGGDQ